jgi:hypothetical protein
MKTTRTLLTLTVLLATGLFWAGTAGAQGDVPAEVVALVETDLETGQEKLSDLGYEICKVNSMKKEQDWFNESTQVCITLRYDKKRKVITEVLRNPETAECQKGLEKARKIWDNYHDGQAPATSAKIEEERQKLADAGFTVSYWINDVSPGRSAEYWVNETSKKAKAIVWETEGNKWVMTNDSDYQNAHNPAPGK